MSVGIIYLSFKVLLRVLPLAFDKISALCFTPFTVKYFADDAIPSSLIPRVCLTCQVPDPRLSAMNNAIITRTLLLLMHIQRQRNA